MDNYVAKALVINPPFLEPHRPPISCAILAELLRLEGIEVQVRDINIELFHILGAEDFYQLQVQHTTSPTDRTREMLRNVILDQCSQMNLVELDWILISCFSYWNIDSIRIACEWLRTQTQARIVVGGAGMEHLDTGRRFYQQGLVDFYVYGEAELAIPALIRGQHDYPGINGRPPEQIDDIEPLPLPNYGFFDLNRYDWLLDSPDVFIYGSRGCVRKCTFCDVEKFWPKFRWRTGRSIANEMINNYERYGVRNFFFADSLVNGNLKEFTTMCEILAGYKENLFHWGSYAIVRPKSAHPASMFDLIQAAGGRFWSIGIESGVDRIRYEMQKKFTNEDVDWHLEQSQRIGLQNNFLCIPTWPSETLEEHHEYLDMFRRWQPYAVDGTIYGIKISATLAIMDRTRLQQEAGRSFEYEHFDSPDITNEVRMTAWTAPGLDHREKFRRTVAIYEAAIKYNWPLTNCLQSVTELREIVRMWIDLQDRVVPRRVIPLIKQ